MIEQKAIDIFKKRLELTDYRQQIPEYYEATELAVKALEKQMAIKPNIEGDGGWEGEIVDDTWICPCCNERYEIDYDVYDYCPNCGQHIDRSEL